MPDADDRECPKCGNQDHRLIERVTTGARVTSKKPLTRVELTCTICSHSWARTIAVQEETSGK